MSLSRLREYPRSAYPPRAARVADRIGSNRTAPNRRGWGTLAATSTAQARKNVRITITRPRDGKTWTPRVMADLAPLAQLLVNLTSDIGRHVGFEFRGGQEVQGGIGSYFMRDIRGSTSPSWHSWNVAFDLMTKGSPRSTTWRSCIPPWMVDLWESSGFGWGGRWTNPFDPHHLEYLYRPQDVGGDMQRARDAAARIRRQLGITKPPPRPPPPPPPPEEDMPFITTPLVGHEAVIGDPNASTTVRSRPSPKADAIIRSFPKGQTETWTIVGWVTGEHSAFGNSDQWLARVAPDSGWEYTAKGNVREVTPPPLAQQVKQLSETQVKALQHVNAAKATLEEG